jgi:hypothetical protein
MASGQRPRDGVSAEQRVNGSTFALVAVATHVRSSSRRLIPLAQVSSAWRLSEQAGKRAGLSKSARHRSVAAQEVRNLGARKPRQNLVPFAENRTNASAITSHPPPEVSLGGFQQATIAVESYCDLPVPAPH